MGVWLLLNCGSVCVLDGHEVQGDIDCLCTQSWPSRVPPCLSASLQRLHIESSTGREHIPRAAGTSRVALGGDPGGTAPFKQILEIGAPSNAKAKSAGKKEQL